LYWDKRAVVLILRKGNEHSGRYVEFCMICSNLQAIECLEKRPFLETIRDQSIVLKEVSGSTGNNLP
jgi:hypothetical protein